MTIRIIVSNNTDQCHRKQHLSCVRKQQRHEEIHALAQDRQWDRAERDGKRQTLLRGKERGLGESEAWDEDKGQWARRKRRGGTARAATAFRHVTFLFTSGCNTHAPHYRLSLTPFHRHIRSEGLWPVYARVHTNVSNQAHNRPSQAKIKSI